MSSYTDTAEKIQSPVLEGIKRLQATNLQMVANFSRAAGALVPMTSELPVGYDPKQFIERGFKFTANILDLQKDYLLKLAETLKPLANTASGTTVNGSKPAARKPAARKLTVRKPAARKPAAKRAKRASKPSVVSATRAAARAAGASPAAKPTAASSSTRQG